MINGFVATPEELAQAGDRLKRYVYIAVLIGFAIWAFNVGRYNDK